MAGYLFTNSMLMLEQAMNYQWTKFRATSDNVVNGDTPGYKAKYVTFEEALDSSIRSALRSTDRKASSVRSVIANSRPVVHVADQESMRMDDNGVNVAEQEVEAARTALQMQYTIESINSNLSLMRTLIRGQ